MSFAIRRFMPRAPTILQSELPYSISARCINREWFNLPMTTVWDIFCEELTFVNFNYDLQIHSFVLMSNHFHLIASTPQANLDKCMHQLMYKTSRRLIKEGNRINQTYGRRYFKCILQEYNYFLNTYKYNYRNPVTAKLCEKVEHYPYSTLQFALKLAKAKFPIVQDTLLIEDPIGILNWMNTPPDPEKLEAMKFGLTKQFFQSKKRRSDNQPIIALNELL